MKKKILNGIYLFFEKLLHWCINPYLRARFLRLLGAHIGNNIRIYEVKLFNLFNGFGNLTVEDDVHVGTEVLIDLADKVLIRKGATISPRVVILTHSDPGSHQNNPLCKIYPPKKLPVEIGRYAWIGASSTIMAGVKIGDQTVVGAGSLVLSDIPNNSLAHGIPARVIKEKIL